MEVSKNEHEKFPTMDVLQMSISTLLDNKHSIHENATWYATNAIFSNTRKANLNWSLKVALPTTFGCVYKMLVACASDEEGRSLFTS